MATILLQGARFLVVVFASRVLTSGEMGAWNAIQALVVYSLALQLGVVNGMNRDIPRQLGAGNTGGALEAEQVGLSAALAVFTLSCLGGILVLVTGLPTIDTAGPVILLASLLMGTQQLYAFSQVRAAAWSRFDNAAMQQVVSAASLALAALLAVPRANLNGLLAAFIAANLSGFAIGVLDGRLPTPKFVVRTSLRLSQIGLPIMLAGTAYAVLTSIDRWVVLWRGSAQHLGQYTPAIVVFMGMTLVQSVIVQLYYPRIAFAYGAREGRRLQELAVEQTILTLVVAIGLLVAVYPFVGYLTKIVLPAYTDGIAAARWSIGAAAALSLAGPAGNVLNACGRAKTYLVILGTASGVTFFAEVMAWQSGGIEGVAAASCVMYFVTALSLMFAARRSITLSFGGTPASTLNQDER